MCATLIYASLRVDRDQRSCDVRNLLQSDIISAYIKIYIVTLFGAIIWYTIFFLSTLHCTFGHARRRRLVFFLVDQWMSSYFFSCLQDASRTVLGVEILLSHYNCAASAIITQRFTLLAEMLGMDLALIGHVQAIGFFQRPLLVRIDV